MGRWAARTARDALLLLLDGAARAAQHISHRGAPARLARELNRMQEQMDGQANVPWWWNYPREEFIDEDILNDWRLREDLTD